MIKLKKKKKLDYRAIQVIGTTRHTRKEHPEHVLTTNKTNHSSYQKTVIGYQKNDSVSF